MYKLILDTRSQVPSLMEEQYVKNVDLPRDTIIHFGTNHFLDLPISIAEVSWQ